MRKTEADPGRTHAAKTDSRIPHFQTVEEEARFWDTHSTTEFDDEFEPVSDVKFLVRRSPTNRAITVRVDAQTLTKLTDQASRQGVGPSTLVRMWILERLREGAVIGTSILSPW